MKFALACLGFIVGNGLSQASTLPIHYLEKVKVDSIKVQWNMPDEKISTATVSISYALGCANKMEGYSVLQGDDGTYSLYAEVIPAYLGMPLADVPPPCRATIKKDDVTIIHYEGSVEDGSVTVNGVTSKQ